MDKAKRGCIESGGWEWVGWGKVVAGKWRQLYLNNNFKKLKIKLKEITKLIIIMMILEIDKTDKIGFTESGWTGELSNNLSLAPIFNSSDSYLMKNPF